MKFTSKRTKKLAALICGSLMLMTTGAALAADGTVLNYNDFGRVVATGQLRASCRQLDKAKSIEAQPYLTGKSEEKLQPGEPVAMEIGIWPMGMKYHKGESIRLTVGAYRPVDAKLPFGLAKIDVPTSRFTYEPGTDAKAVTLGGDCTEVANPEQVVKSPETHNKGRHIIYTGGDKDSYLLIPVVPEK